MSGHHPYSELTKHFTDEDWRLHKIGVDRLGVKIQIAEAIGEKLLRENDELSDLLCESELDFSDKELVQAIEKQVSAVAGTAQDLIPARRQRINELTDEVRGWISLAESGQTHTGELTEDS